MRVHYGSEDGIEAGGTYLCGRAADPTAAATWTWKTPVCKQCNAVIDRKVLAEWERRGRFVGEPKPVRTG